MVYVQDTCFTLSQGGRGIICHMEAMGSGQRLGKRILTHPPQSLLETLLILFRLKLGKNLNFDQDKRYQ